jgi:hypothetical protein
VEVTFDDSAGLVDVAGAGNTCAGAAFVEGDGAACPNNEGTDPISKKTARSPFGISVLLKSASIESREAGLSSLY